MPEGPSLVILKEEAKPFEGKNIVSVSGNSKQDIQCLQGKKSLLSKPGGSIF